MTRLLCALGVVFSIPSLVHAVGYADRDDCVVVVFAVPTHYATQQFAERLYERAAFF